jgi:hypothetical protein
VDHIDDFFEEYPDFDYNATAEIWMEFNRMCDDFDWDSDDYEMREARRKFKAAMVQEFNALYGTDMDDLSSWQKLCHVLNIQPVPDQLKECRQVRVYCLSFFHCQSTWLSLGFYQRVRQTHVNLVDLVDTPRTGAAVRVFPNLKELQNYTIQTEKYFPKEDAYAGGLLRFLLREIVHSYAGGQGRKGKA